MPPELQPYLQPQTQPHKQPGTHLDKQPDKRQPVASSYVPERRHHASRLRDSLWRLPTGAGRHSGQRALSIICKQRNSCKNRLSKAISLAMVLLMAAGATHAQTTNPNHSDTGKPEIAMNTDSALSNQLFKAYQALGDDYEPRTEHLFDDGTPQYINRLIAEDSPYLLQHAHNPVNWYPWGEEAFAAAVAQDKPVFLSIGYATCHWCHVMERESFENLDIARLMNEQFISIKVDREQLPDVDALYMSAVMMINGNGGWPMSSFLDTTGQSFFGGTYFPPDAFSDLLTRVSQLWWQQPEALLDQAAQVTQAINQMNETRGEAREVGDTHIARAVSAALDSFDRNNGGFGGAPKFPRESTLFFLLDQAQRDNSIHNNQGQLTALEAADETLQRMAAGGIHDHVGGGFHRYAVDSVWLVPHFEKMLYNQAALARNYSQAYELTGKDEHRRTATRILDYVLRDMTSPEGLFYSATDADSEGEEGRFFIWTPEELASVLGDEEAQLAQRVWNVTGEGNFEGTSILHTSASLESLAASIDLPPAALQNKIDHWSEQLRIARERREHPLRDEKIISSWNGMMISAFAHGSARLNEPRYLDAATRAAQSAWDKLQTDKGSLYRTYFDGKVSIAGTQADYAYLAEAYVTLYDQTGSRLWLDRAVSLTEKMNQQFWDDDNGSYFMGAGVVGGKSLSTRPKDLYDNSIASGNSVALRLLARLFKRTGEPDYEALANAMISAMSSRIEEQPTAYMYLLAGVAEHIAGEAGSLQYGARGVISARAHRDDDRVVINVTLADGWHVNSEQPLQDYLIPTQVTDAQGTQLPAIDFPKASIQKLGFQRSELSLFDQRFEISAQVPDRRTSSSSNQPASADAEGRTDFPSSTTVVLQVQACNNETCLAPEKLHLSVF